MARQIIRIDESLCDGCGLCVSACAEGAIALVDGKARLVSESYCDGLGACLGDCPQGAITLEERDARPFTGPAPGSEAATHAPSAPVLPGPDAVRSAFARALAGAPPEPRVTGSGCPGTALRDLRPPAGNAAGSPAAPVPQAQAASQESSLSHWPVQLMLVPSTAPFLRGARLVVCADCVPFAVPDFHKRYLDGRSVVVGCPKLDDIDIYRRKLAEIVTVARPESMVVVRMEVPCCGGIVRAVVEARDAGAPDLPVQVDTVGIQGGIRTETL